MKIHKKIRHELEANLRENLIKRITIDINFLHLHRYFIKIYLRKEFL